MKFDEILTTKYNIEPINYLNIVKKKLKLTKLYNKNDIDSLQFSNNKNKKLMMIHDNKKVHFGHSKYKDYIIYNTIDKKLAKEKRKLYLSRATNIEGSWVFNQYSPNFLAIVGLW